MMFFIKLFIVFTFVGCAFAGETPSSNESSNIVIRYNDVNIYRRSLESAPVIGSGAEDYIIKINCLGDGDCEKKIDSIYHLISNRVTSKKDCTPPVYASVRLFYENSAYSEVEADKEEVYKFDHSGDCLTINNQSYKLKDSIFNILNNNPLSEW